MNKYRIVVTIRLSGDKTFDVQSRVFNKLWWTLDYDDGLGSSSYDTLDKAIEYIEVRVKRKIIEKKIINIHVNDNGTLITKV